MNEIILVDKPAGMTSFGVVARVRRKMSELPIQQAVDREMSGDDNEPTHVSVKRTRIKVGHTGTLDPFATGLMILLIGAATKRSDEFLKLDKVYEATIYLGATSTTGDPEGEITHTPSVPEQALTEVGHGQRKIEEVLEQFVGTIEQVPPTYSAIKIDGQRAYKRARKGEDIVIPVRTVTVYSLDLVSYDYPILKIRTHVSSGTYIRTLAEDIGKALGVGAYCQELRRIRIADFRVEDARTLESIGIFT